MAYEIIHTLNNRFFFHYSHVPVSAPKGIELKPSLLSTSCAGVSLTTTSLLGIIVGLASGILTGSFGAVRRLTRGTKWSIPSFKNDWFQESLENRRLASFQQSVPVTQWPSGQEKNISICCIYSIYIIYTYICICIYIQEFFTTFRVFLYGFRNPREALHKWFHSTSMFLTKSPSQMMFSSILLLSPWNTVKCGCLIIRCPKKTWFRSPTQIQQHSKQVWVVNMPTKSPRFPKKKKSPLKNPVESCLDNFLVDRHQEHSITPTPWVEILGHSDCDTSDSISTWTEKTWCEKDA